MFTLNEIVIKSFTYNDIKNIEKKVCHTKYSIKSLSKTEEENIYKEEMSIECTHAIVYLIDQNRFWYYKIVNDEVVEKHHTKNNYDNSVKIIDDMINRFAKLNRHTSIKTIYDIKNKNKEEHITIKNLSCLEQPEEPKKERLKGMILG